jgi:3-hydroxybutyryl-CoA dehydratase
VTVFAGKAYDEIRVGESFSDQVTLTETHLVLSASLFGDFHPVHVNEAFAATTRFGTRIFHGYFTSSVMAAVAGNFFSGTGVAYLEHACRFRAAVKPGDTITTQWTIAARADKTHHGGGIVSLSGTCRNQDDAVVAEAEAKILVSNKPFHA